MKNAIWNDQPISLPTLPREAFPKIYEAGKTGPLQCQQCGQPVSFYLGIHGEPHFFHRNLSLPRCAEPVQQESITTEDEPLQLEGFRMPKSRLIHEESTKQPNWKMACQVSNLPVYSSDLLHHKPSLAKNELSDLTLDQEQMEAVQSNARHLLVLAGAGSGKTRVLTARTAYLILKKQVDPNRILLVTFTSKAAKEMKDRLQRFPGLSGSLLSKLYAGTFHSIFYRILLRSDPVRWHSANLIKFDGEKEYILKLAASNLGIDEQEFAFDQAIQQISKWKNDLLPPEAIECTDEWEESCLNLYKSYEEYKHTHQKFDFDDMQTSCYALLKEDDMLLNSYRAKFRYLLIDEFQDINKVQYEIVRLLSKGAEQVCFVGDDDQSIYSFRGSDSSFLLNLNNHFNDLHTVILSSNYRSGHKIVQTANQIVSENKLRTDKKMRALHDQSSSPVLFYPHDEEEEAIMIVTDITEKIRAGARPGDFAILYRTNVMSRAVFERLAVSTLPFQVDSDYDSFYRRKTVKGMLAYLKAASQSDDASIIADLLAPLFMRKSALQDAKALSILNDCSMLEALALLPNIKPFQKKHLQKVIKTTGTLQQLTPLKAIEKVEQELNFKAYLKKRGNEGNKIDKGSDDIKDLKVAAKRFQTLSAFLEFTDHMTAMSAEIKKMSKATSDAIQLSTIHRSKGMEYKYVYILGCVDGSLPHEYALEEWRDGRRSLLEEERRLLYVGITRAKKEVYLSIPQVRRGKKAHPSRFLKTIKKEPVPHTDALPILNR